MENVNINRLKGKVAEKGMTVSSVADKIGMNRSTLYRKLENNGAGLTVKDANDIVAVLGLTSDEAVAIFFSQTVA